MPRPEARPGGQRPTGKRPTGKRPTGKRPGGKGRGPARSAGRRRLWAAGASVVAVVAVAVLVSRAGDGAKAPVTPGSAAVVGGDFHSLVADPTTPGRLFAGGHQAVSMSADGGRTWSRVASLDDADAMGWGFGVDAVYVSGHPGINRSTDGATMFRSANSGLPDTDVHAFAASRSTLYGAGPALGVIASTDGGRSWDSRSRDNGASFFGRILTAAGDDQHLIAADARGGATESRDGGRTWRRLGGPTSALWVSRSAGGTLYVSGAQGAARSADGGATWAELALPAGATLVEADPTDPEVLYAGAHDGSQVRVMVSRDGGERWGPP